MREYIAILLILTFIPVTNPLLFCVDFAFSPKIIVFSICALEHAKVRVVESRS